MIQSSTNPQNNSCLPNSMLLFNTKRLKDTKNKQIQQQQRKKRVLGCLHQDISQQFKSNTKIKNQQDIGDIVKQQNTTIQKMMVQLQKLKQNLQNCQQVYHDLTQTNLNKQENQFLINILNQHKYLTQRIPNGQIIDYYQQIKQNYQKMHGRILKKCIINNVQQSNVKQQNMQRYLNYTLPHTCQNLCNLAKQATSKAYISSQYIYKPYIIQQQQSKKTKIKIQSNIKQQLSNKTNKRYRSSSYSDQDQQNNNQSLQNNKNLAKYTHPEKQTVNIQKITKQQNNYYSITVPVNQLQIQQLINKRNKKYMKIIHVGYNKFVGKISKLECQISYCNIQKLLLEQRNISIMIQNLGQIYLNFQNIVHIQQFFSRIYDYNIGNDFIF